ncbi:class 1 alpha-mannosidase [Grosmannia clavigera kw1407]|uniref:alpha-1,2-Mannosidase n=1 Tax=Grosmannia clavigera (strain kw1407 / UAMH 11150) TaxID=655863 RepID=F0XLS7_GROCL|nr:class 1 alpha-mannosidase [Grosmannia clavigera kw1407]EFX01204.1 class 1 alpha-mannosidase [Grosmannia clavigera kw1407]
MMSPPRRWRSLLVVAGLMVCTVLLATRNRTELIDRYHDISPMQPLPVADAPSAKVPAPPPLEDAAERAKMRLAKLPDRYPVTSLKLIPKERREGAVPPMQKQPAPKESEEAREVRLGRLAAVKEVFERSWKGYKDVAWLADEGWGGGTMVDALDSLWMMGMHDEFRMAVRACADIDFSRTEADVINLFEVTIRYLGGFLGAYEISGKTEPVLLRKAVEVGEILLGAFDTPNRMPLAKWDWRAYVRGGMQTEAARAMPAAELGSLSLEFTKLTQLTGDERFYDATARVSDVLDHHQLRTRLPGMWPVLVDAAVPAFDGDDTFSLGGKSDSLYEYLPKQWLLLGGVLDQPRHMYSRFLPVAKKHLFRRVLNEHNWPLVFSGDARVVDDPQTGRAVVNSPRGEHLTCFVGGMVGLAARAFGEASNDRGDMALAAQLTDACVWTYNVTATGIGPEKFFYATCGSASEDQAGMRCSYTPDKWRDALEKHWKLAKDSSSDAIDRLMTSGRMAPGYVDIDDPKYMLRPEAIESVFVMWRLTGDTAWQDKAWHMFQSIARYTSTAGAVSADDPNGSGAHPVAAAGILDVTQAFQPPPMDKMESFWMGETLKYFYLVFAEWDLASLDEWVFNTEAHPFRRAGTTALP